MKKVALVTGASAGIGKETAKLLAEAGFIVYGAARRIDKMQDLKAAGVHLLQMDVTEEDSLQSGVDQLLQNEQRIDVLVNNAGYGSYGAVEDVPLSEAKYQFEVNIFGLARLVQLVLPTMRKQGEGKIINVSSIGGSFGEPHGAWYHATKFALEGFSDSLRMELKQFGIDVVVIKPGAIKTEWTGIAKENLLKTSGNGVYKDFARKHANLFARAEQMGSHPSVIAKAIKEAALAKRPKTRYVAGMGAKPLMFLSKVLPDRVFDSVLMSQMK